MSSDGIVIGEKLVGKFLANNDVVVSGQPLFAGEEPPLYQGNLHRLKVGWIDCANHSVEFEIESIRGAFHDSEDHVAFKAAARRCRDERSTRNSR